MYTEIIHIILAVCGTALLTFLIVERKTYLPKAKAYEESLLSLIKGDVTKVEDAVKAELAKVKHVTQSDLDGLKADCKALVFEAQTDALEQISSQVNKLLTDYQEKVKSTVMDMIKVIDDRLVIVENKLNPTEPSTTSVNGVSAPNTTDQPQA